MCAEAVPWRCHRYLIADALVVRGYPSRHIISARSERAHVLSKTANVDGRRITWICGGGSRRIGDAGRPGRVVGVLSTQAEAAPTPPPYKGAHPITHVIRAKRRIESHFLPRPDDTTRRGSAAFGPAVRGVSSLRLLAFLLPVACVTCCCYCRPAAWHAAARSPVQIASSSHWPSRTMVSPTSGLERSTTLPAPPERRSYRCSPSCPPPKLPPRPCRWLPG